VFSDEGDVDLLAAGVHQFLSCCLLFLLVLSGRRFPLWTHWFIVLFPPALFFLAFGRFILLFLALFIELFPQGFEFDFAEGGEGFCELGGFLLLEVVVYAETVDEFLGLDEGGLAEEFVDVSVA
jgi:hypothetical protein